MEKNLSGFAFREVHDLGDGRIEDRPGGFDLLSEERLPEHRGPLGRRRRRTGVDDPARPLDSGRGLDLPEPIDLTRSAQDGDPHGQPHALRTCEAFAAVLIEATRRQERVRKFRAI